MNSLHVLALASLPACHTAPSAATGGETPAELGRVRWERDLARGLAAGAASGKPVFLLFQEVPGCSTCVDFGNGPLSQPLLVEAIEDELVPVCVFNNRGGDDARALERFGEPAWNNPVVRFVDGDGKDLVPRADGVWDTGGIAARTVSALEAAGRDVPAYLALLAREADGAHLAEAVLAMHCFWEGEAELGALDGVVAVEAGFVGGREVVTVTYHEPTLARDALVERAGELPCSAVESAGTPRTAPESDRTRSLDASPLGLLPLTPAQATKVNAALAGHGDVERWLSPRQKALAKRLRAVAGEGALPGDLKDLERPRSLDGLAGYAERLERALAAAEAR